MGETHKIGVMGGTFDPVHIAHLAIAETAVEQLELSKLIFIPAWIAPHKTDKEDMAESAVHRLNMLKLAIADNKKFEVSDLELKREGTSYTIDTLKQLQQQYGLNMNLFLLIGSDNYLTFNSWCNPDEICSLCSIIVYNRPGSLIKKIRSPFRLLNGPEFGLTSTWLRNRIKNNNCVKYFVPEPVLDYINQHNIYMK